MTQEEKRIYLIQAMLSEQSRYGNIIIPDKEEQKQLLRSLFNLRPPLPVSRDFIRVQDGYLKQEITERGIVDSKSLKPWAGDDRIFLWQGDITRLKIDAIVNAANSGLLGCFQPCHNCIDNIIHTLSGVKLRLKCREIMDGQGYEEPAGTAKITPGYNLPCKYVLHTVGPIITGPLTDRDCRLLESCYHSCLALAVKHKVSSIAFCCISTGVFRFPKEEAAKIAFSTVTKYLKADSMLKQVVFNVFTDEDYEIYCQKLNAMV